MRELVSTATPIMIHMPCKSCDGGFMKIDYNAPVLTSYPPQYSHKCDKCGQVEIFRQQYPYITLVPTELPRIPNDKEISVIKGA